VRGDIVLLSFSETVDKLLWLSVLSYLIYALKVTKLSVGTCLTSVTLCFHLPKLFGCGVFRFFWIDFLIFSNLIGRFLLFEIWSLSKTYSFYWATSAMLMSIAKRIVMFWCGHRNHRYLTLSVCTFCACSTYKSFILSLKVFNLSPVVCVQVLAHKNCLQSSVVEWTSWWLLDLLFVLIYVGL